MSIVTLGDALAWPKEDKIKLLGKLRTELWREQARPEQMEPEGDWRVWYCAGGRGSGKSRAGAETLCAWINDHPPGDWAIVAPTFADARDTCVESESGVLRILGPAVRTWNRSLGELMLYDGSRIFLDGADDGALRIQGRNLRGAWCLAPSACIVTLGGDRAISEVREGDQVWTRDGWRKVTWSGMTRRNMPLLEVSLSNGKTLHCTEDHPIWVIGRGWTEAGKLHAGNLLFPAPPPGLIGEDGASIATIPATTSPQRESREGSIRQSGRISTVCESQRAWSFTTSTMTRATTPSRTFRYSQRVTTIAPIGAHSGTRRRRQGFEMASSSRGRDGSSAPSPAPAAAIASRLDLPTTRNTALRRAVPTPTDLRELGLRSGHQPPYPASDVGPTSLRRTGEADFAPRFVETPLSVIAVRRHGASDVYDLTVEDAHEFFAEGVLCHNCDEAGLWTQWDRAWNESLAFAVRHEPSRIVATGTPKMGHGLVKLLMDDPGVPKSRMKILDNVQNLNPSAVAELYKKYGGTRLGSQELDGEWLEAIEGDMLKRAWWRFYDPALLGSARKKGFQVERLPKFQMILLSCDTPLKDKETSDFVALGAWGVLGADRYLLDLRNERLSYDQAKRAIVEMSQTMRKTFQHCQHRVLIENAGYGVELISDLSREIGGVHKISVGAEGNKTMRALAASSDLETGNCFLPGFSMADLSGPDPNRTAAWVIQFIDQCALFPEGPNDDMVDMWSQAINWLRTRAPSPMRTASAFQGVRDAVRNPFLPSRRGGVSSGSYRR